MGGDNELQLLLLRQLDENTHQLALEAGMKVCVGLIEQHQRDAWLQHSRKDLHGLMQPRAGNDQVQIARQDLVVISRIDARGGDTPGNFLVVGNIDGSFRVEPCQQFLKQLEALRRVFLEAEQQIAHDLAVALRLLTFLAGGQHQKLLARQQAGEYRNETNRQTGQQSAQVGDTGNRRADIEEVVLQLDLERDRAAARELRTQANRTAAPCPAARGRSAWRPAVGRTRRDERFRFFSATTRHCRHSSRRASGTSRGSTGREPAPGEPPSCRCCCRR